MKKEKDKNRNRNGERRSCLLCYAPRSWTTFEYRKAVLSGVQIRKPSDGEGHRG